MVPVPGSEVKYFLAEILQALRIFAVSGLHVLRGLGEYSQ